MRELVLSSGETAFLDDEDYERVAQFRWRARGRDGDLYVVRKVTVAPSKQKEVALHRLLMDAKPGQMVDHINGNTLDNRRANLRFCTHTQNMQNMHRPGRLKGVTTLEYGFKATISADKKIYRLGHFKTAIEAARAYDDAARRLHGEFASLNFPDDHSVNPPLASIGEPDTGTGETAWNRERITP